MSAVAVQSFGFGDTLVRAIERSGVAWFVGNDVCKALEVGNVSQALSRLEDEEKDDIITNDVTGRGQSMAIISESGVYSLVFTSRKEAARRFKRWVTHEVLPAIRTTGRYEAPRAANDRAGPRAVDLEGALGTADDRHAIKTALLMVNTYKDLYGAQAGRDMMLKLGFPVPGVDLPLAPMPDLAGAGSSAQAEGDLHQWVTHTKVTASRRDATHLTELYESYVRWCSGRAARPMVPARFEQMMVFLFGHEEHPKMIKVIVPRR